MDDFEIECCNKHCCHGPDGGKLLLCRACGKKSGRGRWLCRMCFLAEMNDKEDDDNMEIDTSFSEYSLFLSSLIFTYIIDQNCHFHSF